MAAGESPSGDFLAELRASAVRDPHAIAIIDNARETTYRDLVARIDHQSGSLVEAGLTPGDRVALVAENSAAFLVSAFAVWAARGVLATMYPSTGPDDLRYTLSNADPALVLVDAATDASVRAAAPARPAARIDLPELMVPRVLGSTLPNPTDLREPLFYICYSSGTTSRPKAVMLSQTALHNGARTYADVWRLTSQDRTIVCLPMAWLYGLASTSMATLLAGGTVIALRRAGPEPVVHAIQHHRASFLPAVTTIFAKLVEYAETSPEPHDFSSLRLAVSGGEPRNEAAFARFEQLAGRPVHDTFCASELFPLVTYDPVTDPRPVVGSAGKLVPRSELKILDERGHPVATGEVGEGFSRGPGLMLGYWRDPEESARAVTADGWYRTRDLVRMDAQGYVYVVGRLSDMIIRGGANVSPLEVETALRQQDSLRDACVVGLPDPVYGQSVAAAVVLEEGATFDEDHVRDALRRRLAVYKVPTRFSIVEDLPTAGTTGKVDRQAVAAILGDVPHDG